MERALPSELAGFTRYTGIPNTSDSKSYFASAAEAAKRCQKDPRCVGLSAQRLFYGTLGTPATVAGRTGEEACFLRKSS